MSDYNHNHIRALHTSEQTLKKAAYVCVSICDHQPHDHYVFVALSAQLNAHTQTELDIKIIELPLLSVFVWIINTRFLLFIYIEIALSSQKKKK